VSEAVVERVETLYQGWARYVKVHLRLPDGSIVSREAEDHGDAACVLAYDPERRTALLVRQLRHPILLAGDDGDVLEAIAGRLEGDAPPDCARREAMEEAGLRIGELEPVVSLLSMPGISTERIHCFLAPYGAEDRIAAGGGLAHEDEQIVVVEMQLAELAARADRGELRDGKTLALLQTLRLRQPGLFAA
jgi:nudix-type nucleoside diphosphatase (YffH/AdpP family)